MRGHSPKKTVLFLGAGFSSDAGFPLQSSILKRVMDASRFSLMDVPANALDQFLAMNQPQVEEFISRAFPDSPLPPLEDVFTLLDLAVARRLHCFGYSCDKLQSARDALKRAIMFVFHAAHQSVGASALGVYRSIAAYLLELRISVGQERDVLSVISTNWDCLLEDCIYWCLRQTGRLDRADIDYCCYTTPLGKLPVHIPSVLQKARGLYNVKVMKLHGSANWLLCPNCERLFTGVGGVEDPWEQYASARACPECESLASGRGTSHSGDAPTLEPFFITPTFLKAFDNAHIQMSWHNAYMDLALADEVVFIGYSLPEADYHVRALLRRAIRPDAQIVVVLTKDDDHKKNTRKRLRKFFAASRYRAFFGKGRVRFELGGVKVFFRKRMRAKSLRSRLRTVNALIKKNDGEA